MVATFSDRLVFNLIKAIQAQVEDTHLISIVGRPMYACGRPILDSQTANAQSGLCSTVCMNAIAMTPLLERKNGSRPWACERCRVAQAGKFFDNPMRLIRLYPYVALNGCESILTLDSILVLVEEPPPAFEWAQMEKDLSEDHPQPEPTRMPGSGIFRYGKAASQAIWMSSLAYLQSKSY